MIVEQRNFNLEPLVARDGIILSPPHIKLGSVQQFIQDLHENSTSFAYVRQIIPGISIEKVRADTFDDLQIRELAMILIS